MYSKNNKGKSFVAKRFTRTLKTISKNVYIDTLDDILINTTVHIEPLKRSLLV